MTFNETGAVDFLDLLTELEDAYTMLQQNAGNMITNNLLDYSVRSGLSIAGWKPMKDPKMSALEWFYFDWESVLTLPPQP